MHASYLLKNTFNNTDDHLFVISYLLICRVTFTCFLCINSCAQLFSVLFNHHLLHMYNE